MKVAQVCHRYFPYIGGVETHVREISERLVKKGFEVEVLTTNPSGKLAREEIINDVEVKRFTSWPPNGVYYFSRDLKKYLLNNSDGYDIVHAHNYHAFPVLYAAEGKNRNKLIFSPHYHGKGHTFLRNLLHIPYKLVAKKIFDKADRIICVSNYEKKLVLDNFRVSEEKISIIPNGLDLKEFEGLEKRINEYRNILYVGRLEKYKQIDYLIKVLQKLDGNIHLEIIGKGSYKKSLVGLTKKLGVTNRVKFNQDLPRKALLQKYVNADLLVLLSKHEAYGLCVAEALTSRTPCIVANTSALIEWIDNENCFGINYPICMDELATLIEWVVGRKIKGVYIPDWNDVVTELNKVYRLNS